MRQCSRADNGLPAEQQKYQRYYQASNVLCKHQQVMQSHVAITVFLIALSQRCPRVSFLTESLLFFFSPEDDKGEQLKFTQRIKTNPTDHIVMCICRRIAGLTEGGYSWWCVYVRYVLIGLHAALTFSHHLAFKCCFKCLKSQVYAPDQSGCCTFQTIASQYLEQHQRRGNRMAELGINAC